jgi:hypothetical protein
MIEANRTYWWGMVSYMVKIIYAPVILKRQISVIGNSGAESLPSDALKFNFFAKPHFLFLIILLPHIAHICLCFYTFKATPKQS